MRQKKSRMGSAAILILSAGVLLWAVLKDGPALLLQTLRSVRVPLLLAAAGCMGLYWAMESLSLHMAARKLYPEQRIRDSVTVSMIGQLFNCITPFASGGQPVQACQLMRRGMPLGSASSALLVKSILYQVVLSVYSLFTLVLRYTFFSGRVSGFGPLVLIGFAVNTAVVVFLIAACCFPRPIERLLRGLVRFLGRLRLVRDADHTQAAVSRELGGFYRSFALLRKSLPLLVTLSALIAAQLTFLFLAPYFVCLALGAANPGMLTVIAAGAFVLMISSFVPLPGASGGAEGSFYLFFGFFFPSAAAARAGVLLWRAVTFYLPIAVGSCFAAAAPRDGPPPSGTAANSVMLSQ